MDSVHSSCLCHIQACLSTAYLLVATAVSVRVCSAVQVYSVDGFQTLNGTGLAVLEGLLGVGRGGGSAYWEASCPTRMRVAGYQVRSHPRIRRELHAAWPRG